MKVNSIHIDEPDLRSMSFRRFAAETDSLAVQVVLQAEYELALMQTAPSSLPRIPVPNVGESGVPTGLILSGKLPNWIAAYVCLNCQGFAWIACENPNLATPFRGDNKAIGWAAICISHSADVLPGSVIRWTTERVERITSGELPDQTSMIQVYSIVETDQETLVNVEHPKDLDPNYLGQALLPELSDAESSRGISITSAYPVWLNVYLAWQASKFEHLRYAALFNSKTIDEGTGYPGSIVVHSRDHSVPVGTFIDNYHYSPVGRGIESKSPQTDETFAGLAIGIVGLPNSGKSVLTRALYELTLELPHVFAQEANPDGQGMYYQNLHNDAYYQRVRQKWPFAPELAEKFCRHVTVLRQRLNLLWVGLGGHPSIQAKRTLDACTHVVLLTRDSLNNEDAEMLNEWRSLCADAGVPIIAEFRSRLDAVSSAIESSTRVAGSSEICGVAAKLIRGDAESTARCRPLAAAILERLLPELAKGTSAGSCEAFKKAVDRLLQV